MIFVSIDRRANIHIRCRITANHTNSDIPIDISLIKFSCKKTIVHFKQIVQSGFSRFF